MKPVPKLLREIVAKANPHRHAVRIPKGGYFSHKSAINEALLQAHANGGDSLAVYPLIGGATSLAAFDLDDHTGSLGAEGVREAAGRIADELTKRDVRHFALTSGGGIGVHVWVPWADLQDAALVRRFMADVLRTCGFKIGTKGVESGVVEIFPKQDQEGENGGSCIALPFGRKSGLLDAAARPLQPLDFDCMPTLEPLLNGGLEPSMYPPPLAEKPSGKQNPVSATTVTSLLAAIPADDYDTWIKVGMILKANLEDEDDAFAMWAEWSAKAENGSDAESCTKKWRTFGGVGRLGMGSLFHMAKDNGWSPDKDKEAEVAEMKQRFGILTVGNRTQIIENDPLLGDEPLTFLGVRVFHDRVRAEETWLGSGRNSKESKGPKWMEHPDAAHFEGIEFDPSKPPGANGKVWNAWRGFPIHPSPGDWSRYREFIHEVIAGGDEERAAWVFNWMALGVQKPAELIGTAPVLFGRPGIGKGVFANVYTQLWKPHTIAITQKSHVLGRFNAFLAARRLVFIDEGTFGGDRATAGVLKTMLTEPHIMLERKGIDPVKMKNRCIFIVASNEASIIPADFGDRRWQMLEVADSRKQDHDYFGKLLAGMDEGGYAGMFYDLLHHDISAGPNPRKTLGGPALFNQFLLAGHRVEGYLHTLLDEARLPFYEAGRPNVTCIAALWDDFNSRQGHPAHISDAVLAKAVIRALGAKSLGQTGRYNSLRLGDVRSTAYEMPPLKEARRAFEKEVGMDVPWSNDLTEWQADPAFKVLADSTKPA